MSKKEEFKAFMDKHIKPEKQEKVHKLIDEGEEKAKDGVHAVKDFFENIKDDVVDGSHEVIEKAKDEVEKFHEKHQKEDK